MPRRKSNLVNKQKRLIATRLIQVSLLVDDYLYQQKPMSRSSAEAYTREITGYKDKCYRDVRSLQVIEKLTRCLKGIMHEQKELHGECETNDNYVFPSQDISNNHGTASPVYSTVDEDLTQYIENDEDIRISEQIHDNETDFNKNKDKKHATAEKDTLAIEEKNMNTNRYNRNQKAEENALNQNIGVIDLCDDEIDELISQSDDDFRCLEPEFNIQRAISNLSIKDVEKTFIPFSQEGSQSILDSFYPTNTTNSLKKGVISPLSLDYDDAITATITHQKLATEMVFNNNTTKIVLPKRKATERKIENAENKTKTAIQSVDTQSAQKDPKDIESVKASKHLTKKRITNKNNHKSQAANSKNTIKTDSKKSQKQKNVKSKGTKQKETVQKTNTTTNNYSDNQYQDYIKELTYPETLNTEHTKNIYSNEQSKLPIYNKTVVNDLSWMENIRFVREIPSEEYQSFTEDDIFWKSYTLPGNWNEKYFNY